MQEVETKEQLQQPQVRPRQSLAWLGQAVSGILLIIIVALHMFFHHFEARGLLNANEVVTHVTVPIIFWLEILFVIVVTYHALVGVRAIIFDLRLSETVRRRVSVGLTILGIITAGYGIVLAFLIRSQLLV